jgi:hypothetical protein
MTATATAPRRAARLAPALAAGIALAAGLALGACKKQEQPAPAPAPAAIAEAEIKRGQDACRAYIEGVCECAKTVPAAQEPCKLARGVPDSLDLLVQVSAHPETERQDAAQTAAAIRKIVARCIEGTAKLPALGCAAPGLGR